MSKLVLQGEHGPVREFILDHERVTIGRKAHSDIHLDASAVSGNHAVIITLGSDSFLEDLDSTNGTKVNQNSVHKCVLQDGDEIRIANYTLTFISEVLKPSAPGKTIAASPRTDIPHPPHSAALDEVTGMPELTRLNSITPLELTTRSDAFDAPDSIRAGRGTLGVLRILSGPGAGQTLALSRPVTTLGKPGIQVAAITQRDGEYYLGLVEGTDLPLINGSEIKTLPCQLQPGDVISIAGTPLEFSLKQA